MALPAKRGGIVRTAADGTEKTVFLHGNAFSHYMTDAEGNWLDEETLQPMSAEAKKARIEANASRAQARRVQQEKQLGGELNLAPRGLLILVSYKDKAFSTLKDTMENMLNGENFTRSYSYEYTYGGKNYSQSVQSSGSARQYFHDQSWGQYNPIFDVVGPYTVSEDLDFYGKNDSQGNDQHVGELISEACKLADADGVDFTLYDNNNDGNVDFVYVIYAGYGEADGGAKNTVWPHNYDMRYYYQYDGLEKCIVDGKTVRNYACSNEIQYYADVYAGIGTFCHEFSHVLGLPDLYVTVDMSNPPHTLCDWDILDYGPYNNDGNTPPAYSAYERFYMGWLKPRVLDKDEAVTLNPLNDSKEALLMCKEDTHNLVGNDPNPTEFYILENRKQEGWDKYLPGKGMLITKIKYSYTKWENNTVNNTASAMGVDMMEATANTGDYGKAKDAYPAGAKTFYGLDNHSIENIRLTSGVITFDFTIGAQGIEDVETGEAAQKILRDGQILIIRGGKTYDLNGREL
ncbi:MAG: M6 family metalloprotease domain-containing protein [Paludibacteraceae bacterium]|nr:M6 family metalloprotease domain-containing protein [Paludibacteraceae bacterium]